MKYGASIIRLLVRVVGAGVIVLLFLLVVGLMFEGILRSTYESIPITHEHLLLTDDKHVSDDYIFEKDFIPQMQHDDEYSVAVIGDSFSDCEMFVTIRCYPNILETILAQEGKKSRCV